MPVYREVKKCRLCESERLTDVLDLGEQYVVDFVPQRDEQRARAPLKMIKCDDCDLVQLRHSVEPDLLYKKFWYRSGISESMRTALREIADFATDLVESQAGDVILDIGANDGTLLGWYTGKVKTVGVDPCGELLDEGVQSGKVDVALKDYFSAELVKPYGPYKIITAIAMFYDLENPVQFLKDCKSVLAMDGVIVVQMNYLVGMLRNCAVDNVAHEHLTYYSVHTMRKAAEKAGLEVVGAQENEVNGGSFRMFLMHPDATARSTVAQNKHLDIYMKYSDMLYRESKMALSEIGFYQQFARDILDRCGLLQKYVTKLAEEGEKVYIYGASTRGTVLMQLLNLSDGVILGAAERDEKKYDLHMVGGTWPQIYPEEYCRQRATHFLVLPWHFRDSIVQREWEWMARGGKLIFPLPVPEVVGGDGRITPVTKAMELEPVRRMES